LRALTHNNLFVCAATAVMLLAAGSLRAQTAPGGAPKRVTIVRAATPPVIDGELDDAVWSSAAVITDLHQILPNEYEAPSEFTEIYLLYDENALYVAARMPHKDPSTMHASVLRQGETFWGDDLFAVILDPFNDQRNGYRFQVNANGIRMQALYQDTTHEMWDWNGIWAAAAAEQEDGWSAEMAIPFKTLSFNPANDTWGINFRRDIGIRDERIGWVSFNRTQDPSNEGLLVGLSDLELGRGLDIAPSVSLRQKRTYGPDDLSTELEPSVDVFYKISPSLNGSLTVNTDFSATEVDDRQVNLTRFGLFFPEKRDFFLRDSDIFRFGRLGLITGGGGSTPGAFPRDTLENGQPFFSRRIGLSSTGQQVDLNYGGKLSGRMGRWDLGALAIRQDQFESVAPSNLFVGRVAANVLPESSVGIIVTNGDPRSNLDNSVVGADFRYFNTRLPGGRTLEGEAWLQQSTTEGLEGDNGAWGLRLRSPNTRGLRGGIGVKELQANFNPALGFVNRKGIQDQTAELGYTWRLRQRYIRSIYSGLDAQRIDLIDGSPQSEVLTWRLLEMDSSRRDRYRARYYQSKEVLPDPAGVVIPAGEYSFDESEFEVRAGQQRTFAGNIVYRTGQFYDGHRDSLSGSLVWRKSEHFRSSMDVEVNDVELPHGDFTTRVVQLRTDIIFSATLSWVTLIQYDNVSQSAGINSRLHWIPEAGREAFIVLNHNFIDLNDRFQSQEADLTLKYNFTLRF
jgi:hypothetical protein